MNAPLRLLAYTDAETIGGAELSLANLLGALADEIEVSLLGVDRNVVDTIAQRRKGTSVRVVRPVRSKRDVRAILAHVNAVRTLRPALLHANLREPWTGQYGIVAGMLVPGVQVIAVEQAPIPSAIPLQRGLRRLLMRRLAAHVAVGEQAARNVERYLGLRPDSVRAIYNGVPDHPYRAGNAPDGRIVGTVARLAPEKGLDVLVRAVAKLDGVDAVVVGEGPERANLEQLARDLGVQDRVALPGWSDDPREQLPHFEIFVLPSRHEGLPLAIIEAMLARLPVVATNVGSVAEAVVHEQTGLLVPPDDVAALTAAIRRVLADPAFGAQLGSQARAYALERFTSPVMARAFEELYAEVLA